jgi:hypothetical protein
LFENLANKKKGELVFSHQGVLPKTGKVQFIDKKSHCELFFSLFQRDAISAYSLQLSRLALLKEIASRKSSKKDKLAKTMSMSKLALWATRPCVMSQN